MDRGQVITVSSWSCWWIGDRSLLFHSDPVWWIGDRSLPFHPDPVWWKGDRKSWFDPSPIDGKKGAGDYHESVLLSLIRKEAGHQGLILVLLVERGQTSMVWSWSYGWKGDRPTRSDPGPIGGKETDQHGLILVLSAVERKQTSTVWSWSSRWKDDRLSNFDPDPFGGK